MTAFLLYFASHWTLVIATILIVVVLGAVSWFLKNWKIAAVAITVAVAGFLYQGAVTSGIKIQMAADSRAKLEQAAEENEALQERITTLNNLTLKNALQAKADADTIEKLEQTASETPTNDGACFDIDTTRRVRAIGSSNAKHKVATPASTGRHTGLFSKGPR